MSTRPLINKFLKGVNTDIAEDLLPEGFLSNGHNIKLTNNDSKQGIAQKQEGYIKKLDGYGENLKPLAATVFNNIIYIVSYNETGGYTEYGTYPSADLATRATIDGKEICDKVNKYAPLPNYLNEPIVFANPSNFYNIAHESVGNLSTRLTTSTGVDWEIVSVDDGLVCAPPVSGATDTDLIITVEDNLTCDPITKRVVVKCVGGSITTTITIYQQIDPALSACGSFSVETLNGLSGTTYVVYVSYTPKTSTGGWSIVKQSGTASASFVPSFSTGTYIQTLATITGSDSDTAVYALTDVDSSDVLDTLSITISASDPVVVINNIIVRDVTMDVNCQVLDDGGAAVTARGSCWSETINPTTSGDHTTDGTGEGSFTSFITGLSPSTEYFIRAYATNSQGTQYTANYGRTTTSSYTPTTGEFIPNSYSGEHESEGYTDIHFTKGTNGTSWLIEKDSGDAEAIWFPDMGSAAITSASVLVEGIPEDTATYNLVSQYDSAILDTFTITIT